MSERFSGTRDKNVLRGLEAAHQARESAGGVSLRSNPFGQETATVIKVGARHDHVLVFPGHPWPDCVFEVDSKYPFPLDVPAQDISGYSSGSSFDASFREPEEALLERLDLVGQETEKRALKINRRVISPDGLNIRYLQETKDGLLIETGYYNHASDLYNRKALEEDEHIFCLSSQAGCKMACVTCASSSPLETGTGKKRLIRSLSSKEIVDQVENVIDDNGLWYDEPLLFSFMGAGEIGDNFDNVFSAIRHLVEKYQDRCRLTVSTIARSQDTNRLLELATADLGVPIKLHLSLHAPTDQERRVLLPAAGPISQALEFASQYAKLSVTTVKLAYMLIDEINDSPDHARQLASLLVVNPDYLFRMKIKLCGVNPHGQYRPSHSDRAEEFKQALGESLSPYLGWLEEFVSFDSSKDGGKVRAGCGQLRKEAMNQFQN